ncbi:MAG: hypothetical protein M1830_007695 [Pleopsidium flavum]|nr:MAG: hypothetical protein M1830_007695 [Pleopsidium flavum]
MAPSADLGSTMLMAKAEKKAGSLIINGSGIASVAHFTRETVEYIRQADKVLHAVTDLFTEAFVQQNKKLHVSAEDCLFADLGIVPAMPVCCFRYEGYHDKASAGPKALGSIQAGSYMLVEFTPGLTSQEKTALRIGDAGLIYAAMRESWDHDVNSFVAKEDHAAKFSEADQKADFANARHSTDLPLGNPKMYFKS